METDPFSSITTTLIIAAIVQTITLIVFFVMAANVAKIKKLLTFGLAKTGEIYIQEAELSIYMGDIQAAIKSYRCARYRYEKYDEFLVNGEDCSNLKIDEIDKAIAKLRTEEHS